MGKQSRGLLTAKEERGLARLIDKLTPFENKIVERCDFFFYVTVIRLLDNLLLDKVIPEGWVHPIRNLIELAKAKDTKAIGELVAQTAAGNMDIPFLNETGEKMVFLHAYGLVEAKLYEMLLRLENNIKSE
jgi:hypothetical protein